MPWDDGCTCVCLWRLHRRGGLWLTERLIDKRRLTGAGSQWGPRERTFSRWWSQTPWTPRWWSLPQPPPRWWWRGSARWRQSRLMRWRHKHTQKDIQKIPAHQRLQSAGHNWAQCEAWRLMGPSSASQWESGGGTLLFLSRPRAHSSTVSESGLNSPRWRRRCPSSQTKTHSGWIVSHSELPHCSNCLRWQTADCFEEWLAV